MSETVQAKVTQEQNPRIPIKTFLKITFGGKENVKPGVIQVTYEAEQLADKESQKKYFIFSGYLNMEPLSKVFIATSLKELVEKVLEHYAQSLYNQSFQDIMIGYSVNVLEEYTVFGEKIEQVVKQVSETENVQKSAEPVEIVDAELIQ